MPLPTSAYALQMITEQKTLATLLLSQLAAYCDLYLQTWSNYTNYITLQTTNHNADQDIATFA